LEVKVNIKRIIFIATGVIIAVLIFYQVFLRSPVKDKAFDSKPKIKSLCQTKAVQTIKANKESEIQYIDKDLLIDFLYKHAEDEKHYELIDLIKENLNSLEAEIDIEDIYPDDEPEQDPWDHM